MTDTVKRTQIKLYFPPDTACCIREYENMPSQEYKVMAEVSTTKKSTKRLAIMDIEPTDGPFLFLYKYMGKNKKRALRKAVFNATCEALGVQPKSTSLAQSVPEVLFE